MNNLYDILEICLQEIENGADVDTVLFRYPEFADELRPILVASVKAKNIAVPGPSSDVMRRNRAKVLQHAAQMREAKVQPSRRLWSVPLRRALVSLAVIGALFISSTSLVRAASTTLPGDNLYPVKRTWEGMRVLLTFNMQLREALEVEHENERLEELYELFAEGRSAEVDFAGLVTRQNGDLWLIAKIPVVISNQTDLRDGPVAAGDAVRVRGVTQSDGTVLAERVDVLDAGVPLPEVEDDDDEPEPEQESPANENESLEENSGQGSEEPTPEVQPTRTSKPESEPEKSNVEGTVDSINGNIVVVDGQPMDISNAEIEGTPAAGAAVKVEGYFNASGIFIVTKIEFFGNNSGGGDDSSTNDDGNDDDDNSDNNDDRGGDDNGNDDDSSGSNSNDDDDSGKDDNGGGGSDSDGGDDD